EQNTDGKTHDHPRRDQEPRPSTPPRPPIDRDLAHGQTPLRTSALSELCPRVQQPLRLRRRITRPRRKEPLHIRNQMRRTLREQTALPPNPKLHNHQIGRRPPTPKIKIRRPRPRPPPRPPRHNPPITLRPRHIHPPPPPTPRHPRRTNTHHRQLH